METLGQTLIPEQLEQRIAELKDENKIDNVIKVIALGNSGAGKSASQAALYGEEDSFEHKSILGSCTTHNSFGLVIENRTAYVICNVPGLIEIDSHNIARNKEAIDAVFKVLSSARVALYFCMHPGHGRLNPLDFEAIRCVREYVKFSDASYGIVVTDVDWKKLNMAPEEYRHQVFKLVEKLLGPNVTVGFTDHVEKDVHGKFPLDGTMVIRAQLLQFLEKLTPEEMHPHAILELDYERLKKEVESITKEMKYFKDQMNANREKHQKEIQDERDRHEKEMVALKEQIQNL